MAKDIVNANENIHVLADETLGGIKREYVEVDRKAEVGEKIVIVEKADRDDWYENGDIFTVDRVIHSEMTFVESDAAASSGNCSGGIFHDEYHVLEPTNILIVNSQRFEMVNDNAEKGDMVIVTDSYDFPVGHVDTVKEVDDDRPDGSVYLVEGANDETYLDRSEEEYRVLVPVESAEDEPQPADLIDVIANLAQEVASLKRTVARHRDEIDTLYKDKRTLGEELARLAVEVGKETESSAKVMAEAFVALRRAGL